MSYEPEILVSTDRDVLNEFRNPFTHAVCWDASQDDEFQSLVENVLKLSKVMDVDPFEPFTSKDLKRVKQKAEAILLPNVSYMKSMMPHLFSIVMDSRPEIDPARGLLRYFQMPSEGLSFASDPHVDLGEIGVFGSFNRRAQATSCVPLEYAGDLDLTDHTYPFARMDRSVVFPSASVYIVDIGVQPHCSPYNVPDNEFRVLETACFTY